MSLYGDGIQPGARFNQLVAIRFVDVYDGHRVWEFECQCGLRTVLRAESVRRGNNVCCGNYECLLRHKRESCPDPELGARNYVLRYYRASAASRGREFLLTDEQCLKLFKEACTYCGCEPSNVSRPRKTRAAFVYNGIDRKDNSVGYTVENSVPCCKICNIMKQAMTPEAFKEHIARVYKNLSKKDPQSA